MKLIAVPAAAYMQDLQRTNRGSLLVIETQNTFLKTLTVSLSFDLTEVFSSCFPWTFKVCPAPVLSFPSRFNNGLTVKSIVGRKHTHIPFLRLVHMVGELVRTLPGSDCVNTKQGTDVADVAHSVSCNFRTSMKHKSAIVLDDPMCYMVILHIQLLMYIFVNIKIFFIMNKMLHNLICGQTGEGVLTSLIRILHSFTG